jgi:hypothetical protein
MQTYTFTTDELKALLAETIRRFTQDDGVFDFSFDGLAAPVAIDEIMAELEPQNDIPFDGSSVIYITDDNTSRIELGLTEAM